MHKNIQTYLSSFKLIYTIQNLIYSQKRLMIKEIFPIIQYLQWKILYQLGQRMNQISRHLVNYP